MAATITAVGNLGRNATYTENETGPMTKFSIAVSDKQKDGSFESTWYDVVCFKYTASNTQNLEKGQRVLVTGKFKPRSYVGKDGTTKTSLSITANEVYVLEKPKQLPNQMPAAEAIPADAASFADMSIPF